MITKFVISKNASSEYFVAQFLDKLFYANKKVHECSLTIKIYQDYSAGYYQFLAITRVKS